MYKELIDFIVSTGSCPANPSPLTREEVIKVENYAANHGDAKLTKYVKKILKDK